MMTPASLMPDPRLLRTCLFAIAILLIAGCSKEADEYTSEQRACINKQYTMYNSAKIDQCVKTCIACMNGNVATCTTSCKLKGAS